MLAVELALMVAQRERRVLQQELKAHILIHFDY